MTSLTGESNGRPISAMDVLEAYFEANMATWPPESVRAAAVGDFVYATVLDAVLHADVRPSEPLSKNRLAKMLGVSRTPVSDALGRLAFEGFMDILSDGTVLVRSPTLSDVIDAVEVRRLLEPGLYAAVARASTAQFREGLEAALEEMEAAAEIGDALRWARADTTFHRTVHSGCPNKLLARLVELARNRVLRTVGDEHTTSDYLVAGTADHRELAERLLAGDGAGARQVCMSHLDLVLEHMRQELTRGSGDQGRPQ